MSEVLYHDDRVRLEVDGLREPDDGPLVLRASCLRCGVSLHARTIDVEALAAVGEDRLAATVEAMAALDVEAVRAHRCGAWRFWRRLRGEPW